MNDSAKRAFARQKPEVMSKLKNKMLSSAGGAVKSAYKRAAQGTGKEKPL